MRRRKWSDSTTRASAWRRGSCDLRPRTAAQPQESSGRTSSSSKTPSCSPRPIATIAQGKSAGFAWRAAINEAVHVLGSLDDGHLAARADDLRDLELQLLETVAGAAEPAPVTLPAGAILVARDLLPSQFLALDAARIARHLHGEPRRDLACRDPRRRERHPDARRRRRAIARRCPTERGSWSTPSKDA